ncbi:MAG: HAD hydrolase family protein, partial [Catenulispora sp.]|nr:HAD hydrolase family protein [Catenulispora sp.]
MTSGVPVNLFHAVALDLDGTLTSGGALNLDALSAIDRQRGRGRRVLLVTGRILAELEEEFPGLADRFDAVVAENGCVLRTPQAVRALADPVDPELRRELVRSGVPVRSGQVLLACGGWAGGMAFDAVARLGLDVQVVRNRAELMLLPPGVTKGTGLQHALDELGLSPHNTVGVGDAENDHTLLESCELGVAVGNAVDALKKRADLVLEEPNGTGVAALLEGPLLGGGARPHRHVTIGSDPRGAAVRLPASRTNILIEGGSGAGKSYLLGLLAERLALLGYAVLVIDPEGDHTRLAHVPDSLVVGDGDLLPAPEALAGLAIRPHGLVVADLSQLPPERRDRYAEDLAIPVRALRAARGYPHWILVDEAQQGDG